MRGSTTPYGEQRETPLHAVSRLHDTISKAGVQSAGQRTATAADRRGHESRQHGLAGHDRGRRTTRRRSPARRPCPHPCRHLSRAHVAWSRPSRHHVRAHVAWSLPSRHHVRAHVAWSRPSRRRFHAHVACPHPCRHHSCAHRPCPHPSRHHPPARPGGRHFSGRGRGHNCRPGRPASSNAWFRVSRSARHTTVSRSGRSSARATARTWSGVVFATRCSRLR